ncbi:MAG: cupredoxin family copper-binding protein [Chloroflexota bacterium]
MRNNISTTLRAATMALLLILLLLPAAACQQSPATTPPAPQPGAPQTAPSVEVNIQGFAFTPDSITIPTGTTVTWHNNDGVPHTVTANAGQFDSGSISRGQSFSYTFNQKGAYDYHCTIHPSMTGKVIVE